MTEASLRAAGRPSRHTDQVSRADVVRVSVLTVAAVAASAIGLTSFDPAITVALVFPSSGVGVLWLASSSTRTLPFDVLGLASATIAGALLVDLPIQAAVMAAVVTVSHALVWYVAVGMLAERPLRLDTLRSVAVFMAACAAGAVVSAGLRALGLGLLPAPEPVDAALTALRNLSWGLGLGAFGLLVLPLVGSRSELRRWADGWPWSKLLAIEAGAVLLATGWVCRLMFGDAPMSLGFALMLSVLWAALRTPPVVAVGFALVLGSVMVLATLERQSPFVQPGQDLQGAVVAQALMVSLVLAALVIAVGTQERTTSTERAMRAELEASARAALFSAALEHLSEGVSVITEDHHYSVRNPAALELTGRRGFLHVDATDPDQPVMVDQDGRPLTLEEMPHARALASGEPIVRELVRVRTGRGEERRLEISSTPVEDAGSGYLVVNTIRDVTRQHEERDQLVSFAGVVAHDLKNPLTVIRGWSESVQEELAADGPPDVAALRSMVTRVQSASDQMLLFIDDLLGITVARDRPLDLEPLDLSALAEEVGELRRARGTNARVAVQPGMRVTGDRFLVRQLLDNLIGNAVKYVGTGTRPSVTVTATELGKELDVSITDNGIGIPVESRQRVFDSFVRAHGSRYTGTGLGLAICARVVSRHGGRIWIADHDGPGTRISFTLPRG